jgi:hypothetical protein
VNSGKRRKASKGVVLIGHSRLFTIHGSLFTVLKMAIPHLPAMLIFAFLVSVVFGVLSKDTPRERLIYGAKSFGAFVGIALALGWIMYFIPH